MSLYDYQESKRAETEEFPFYALVMACMRKADDENAKKLKAAWPDTWDELMNRYGSPGGLLESEREDS